MTVTARGSLRLAVASALCLAAGVATAQDGPETVGSLDEVVVTAQKRVERLIDVPASITAVSSDALTRENLVSVTDFYSRIPGLQFAAPRLGSLSLRGITTGSIGNNPTLALLIDDVPFGATISGGLGNSRFPDLDPSTLERIEVLRGPQGTLYGAASLGGLLKYVTRQPRTDAFSGRVEVGAATVTDGGTGWNARATLNLPLFSERAALLVSAFNREEPAYLDNVRPGLERKDVNTTHTYGGRAALLVKPLEGLEITLAALLQKRRAEFPVGIQSLPTTTGAVPNYQPAFGRNTISVAQTGDVGDQELYTGRLVWDLGGMQLTSITSWSRSTGINDNDVSRVFTFIPIFYGFGPNSTAAVKIADTGGSTKKTQELRLSGKAGPVDWIVGGFWTDEEGRVDQSLTLFAPDGSLRDVPYNADGPSTYEEKSLFADAVWHLSPRWDLEAGVRVSRNEQSSGGGTTTTTAQVRPVFGPTRVNPITESEDDAFTFAISPTYRFNPDLMAYARVATGYRPGGPNATLPNVPPSFDSDRVTNYELGMKGLLLDKSLSLTAAIFQINWTDVQLPNTDSASNFTYRTNGGEARSRGVELAVDYRPFPATTISANATVLDAVLTETLPTLAATDTLVGASGDRLPGSAEFTANLSAEHNFALTASLDAYVGGTLTYVGDRKSDFVNSGARAARNAQRFSLPSYTQVDLRAGLATTTEWRLDLYVRNATDEEGVVTANNRNGTSTSTVSFLQPRTYGLTLSKAF